MSLMTSAAGADCCGSSRRGNRYGIAVAPSCERAKSVWFPLPFGRSSMRAWIASGVAIVPSGLATQPPGCLRRASLSLGTSEGLQDAHSPRIAPATFRQPGCGPTARLSSSCLAGSPKRRRSCARTSALLPSPSSVAGTTVPSNVMHAWSDGQLAIPGGTSIATAWGPYEQ